MERDGRVNNSLLEQNPSYRRLALEHRELEVELDDLVGQAHVSSEEELEKRIIKKKKLQIKDEMEQIVQRYLDSISDSRATTES